MKKIRIINVLFNALILFSLLLFTFVAFIVLSGTKGYAVQTDSMSPVFKTNSVVFVKPVAFDALTKGDIVAVNFPDGSGVFTHRITAVDKKNQTVTTKGDSNLSDDPEPSSAAQIIGKYWFSVPYIGFLPLNLKSNTIIYFLMTVAAALLVVRLILQSRNKANS